jgi:uncharacterized protein (TIGR00288 family)
LSPWWLRPTSEGAENEDKEKREEQQEPTSPLPAAQAAPLAQAVRPIPADEGNAAPKRSTPEGDLEGAGTAGVPAAPAAPPADTALRPADTAAAPAHQPAQPARPASSEPYRSFWQPREPAPFWEDAASPAQPAQAPAAAAGSRQRPPLAPEGAQSDDPTTGGAAAAAPMTPRASEASSTAGLDEADAPTEPRGPREPREAEQPAPAAVTAGRRARSEPRGLHPIAAPFPAAVEPADADLEVEGEGEGEGEGETEERDEESRPGVRKKRSRRGRGGRRKNGRAAAGAGTGAPEPAEDEDDDSGPDEAPAQFPSAASAPSVPPPAPLAPRAPRAGGAGESYVIAASDLDSMSREIIISVPDRQRPQHEERKIAVFCDFENIALGVRDSEISKLDIGLILERLLEKGKIIVKKAYADWERYSDYKRPFHEAAIELIDIPQKFYSGKNSADIKMVVDAMDLSYSKEHLDTFVILSGDSDFSPLVSKLKENNKYVIGIGVKNSSSNLLVDNCDEFIYYEDIWRDAQKGPKLDGLSKKTAEAFSLMVESIQALLRENKDVLWGSMIKQTMQRKKPSFNEGYYGYSTFSELLEDAERKNIVKLKKDQRSGTYIVTGFAKSGDAGPGRRQA